MKVTYGPTLKERTTLRVGGTARLEATGSPADLEGLLPLLEKEGGRPVCLGKGSNLLAADGELDLALVRLEPTRNVEVLREQKGVAVIRASGGESLPWLLGWCGKHGFSGLESLAGIPGSVGGAVAMNAGSYGRSMDDVMQRVQIWSESDGLRWLERGQWQAGYRTFSPECGGGAFWIVTAVELQVEQDDRRVVKGRMREVFATKKRTQPVLTWTCGCAFKNPPGERAAWQLLKHSGVCGQRVGGMRFSQLHCNFLVNTGEGTGTQALELLDEARTRVGDRFGIELELEVRVLS